MSENKFELIIENGVLKEYKGQSKVVEIPEGITEIGESAFQECEFLEEVYSKSSILKTIGAMAFENCKNLKVCKLNALKGSIENSAFSGCEKLKNFVVPNGTIRIGSGAFDNCKDLLYVAIPSSVFIIDGSILDVGNKKTVILGELGSEAAEYASNKMIPFKEDTQKTRQEFVQLEAKNDNTGYKDFNIFGETVRCHKSILIYQEILDFFNNFRFMDDVLNYVPSAIFINNRDNRDKGRDVDFTKISEVSNVYINKTKKMLEKYGIFINDLIFVESITKYSSNFYKVCDVFIKTYEDIVSSALNSSAKLDKALIAEAESKITGLSYGVIGSPLTLVTHAIDEYREENRQRKEAYRIANIKATEFANQIQQKAEAIYAEFLNNIAIPELEKSVEFFVDGLLQFTIKEMIEAKLIEEEILKAYDIAKSKKIIEQANKNANIDKKYAIALALKLYPLNIDAVILAFKEDLLEKDVFDLIDFLNIYQSVDLNNFLYRDYDYITLLKIVSKYNSINSSKLRATLNENIDLKAGILIEKINNGYDPSELDEDTWNSLVENYNILTPENSKLFNLTEKDIKNPTGQKLLSEAVRKHNAVKKIEYDKANKIKQCENDIIALKKEIAEKEKEKETWIKQDLIWTIVAFVLFGLFPLAMGVFGFIICIIMGGGFDSDDTLLYILLALSLVGGGIFTFCHKGEFLALFPTAKNKRKEIELLINKVSKKESDLKSMKNNR